jgi:hypothetical protein
MLEGSAKPSKSAVTREDAEDSKFVTNSIQEAIDVILFVRPTIEILNVTKNFSRYERNYGAAVHYLFLSIVIFAAGVDLNSHRGTKEIYGSKIIFYRPIFQFRGRIPDAQRYCGRTLFGPDFNGVHDAIVWLLNIQIFWIEIC